MRKRQLLGAIGVVLFGLTGPAWAQCPQDTTDLGICDTLYVTYHNPGYQLPPCEVYFTVQVTHDSNTFYWETEGTYVQDSISAFVVPLKITHTNPAAYCSIPEWRNNTQMWPSPDTASSIFRHFRGLENRMMALSEQGTGKEWAPTVLDIHYDTSGAAYFWLALIPTAPEDKRWWEGSKTLLATITLLVEDTMTICIDTCFWPPASHLLFTRYDAWNYFPRDFMPLCQFVGVGPSPCIHCSPSESRHSNGTFQTELFSAWSNFTDISDVEPVFQGTGISNHSVDWLEPPPRPFVAGHVVYTVDDHCASGGTMELTVRDALGLPGYCSFDLLLSNNPPAFDLGDTWIALTDHTLSLEVLAPDPDDDPVDVIWDAFWFEADSLRPPTNSPSFEGEDPAILTWLPAEADTGTWLSSFSAADACGAVDTQLIAILVAKPHRGDCNGDGIIDVADVIQLTNYLFLGGSAPDPLELGDVSCDTDVNIADVVYLINYLFLGGIAPCC
jgi:hypothetical protein